MPIPMPKLAHWPKYLFILLVMVCPMVAAMGPFGGGLVALARYAGATVAGLALWSDYRAREPALVGVSRRRSPNAIRPRESVTGGVNPLQRAYALQSRCGRP